METENKCIGIGEMFGHKFQAVYEVSSEFVGTPEMVGALEKMMLEVIENSSLDEAAGPMDDMMRQMQNDKKVYVYHICTRCGKTVKKEQQEQQ